MVCLVLVHVGVVLEGCFVVSVGRSEDSYSKGSIVEEGDPRVEISGSSVEIVVIIEAVLKIARSLKVLGILEMLGLLIETELEMIVVLLVEDSRDDTRVGYS